MASCTSETSSADEIKTEVYSLAPESSTLWWRGEENADHFHYGHITITEGTLTTENDVPVSGFFLIDPNTITPETEGYPDEKLEKLGAHLKDSAFFFIDKFPEIKVTTGVISNGKMDLDIDVIGTHLLEQVPVEVDKTDNGLNVKGDFTIDFAKTQMPFITEVDPETGQPHAKSIFQFKLDLKLNKK